MQESKWANATLIALAIVCLALIAVMPEKSEAQGQLPGVVGTAAAKAKAAADNMNSNGQMDQFNDEAQRWLDDNLGEFGSAVQRARATPIPNGYGRRTWKCRSATTTRSGYVRCQQTGK